MARPLVDAGATPEELARAAAAGRSRRRRSSTGCASGGPTVGLPHDDDAPLLMHADGEPVTAAQVPLHLRRARLTRA